MLKACENFPEAMRIERILCENMEKNNLEENEVAMYHFEVMHHVEENTQGWQNH